MQKLSISLLSMLITFPLSASAYGSINGELLIRKPINTTKPAWHQYTRPAAIPSVATNNIQQKPLDYKAPSQPVIRKTHQAPNIQKTPHINEANAQQPNEVWQPERIRNKKQTNLVISLSSGYRQDEFNWNIAGDTNGNNPNILSELTWSDLQFYELRGAAEYTIRKGFLRGFHLDGAAYYAEGFSGDNQDSDWASDNRQNEYSRSNNDANHANSKGVSLAVGYNLNAGVLFHPYDTKRNSIFTPMVGYSRQELNLLMTDGYQTIPALGSFAGLNSSYDSVWSGPFVGFKLSSKLKKHRIGLRTEVHFADYDAEANWNLRTTFKHPKSFEQVGDGTGVKIKVDYGYQVADNWELFANAAIESWNVKSGRDTIFFSDDTTGSTKLNEVNWDSQAYHVGISYLW